MKKRISLTCVFLAIFLPIFLQKSTPVSFTENFVNLKEFKVHYLDFGGEGLPVIIIPGGRK